VADTSIVNRVVDLTVFIVRADVLDKRQLPALEKLYQQEIFRNMSLIFNAVDYHHEYEYYGQYGYGYHKK
jgi:hypothetical protein